MSARRTAPSAPLIFNGLDVATGTYGLCTDLQEIATAAQLALAGPPPGRVKLPPRLDPRELSDTGWAVVFARGTDPAVVEALRPLLDLRRGQACVVDERRYAEIEGVVAPGPEESALAWRTKRQLGFGALMPAARARLPFFVLLVGDVNEISFGFQHGLAGAHAVGRVHFRSPEGYARYAEAVVRRERAWNELAPAEDSDRRTRLAIFGVDNVDDPATTYAREDLVEPLLARLGGAKDVGIVGAEATRARLLELLGGSEAPRLLFASGHGLTYSRRRPAPGPLGALVCQDWPGPELWQAPIPERFYVADEHLASDLDLRGMVAFFFACFGAGTPQYDSFARAADGNPQQIAPRPYLSRLPARLLELGAGAVIGHVDRARGFSYCWPGAGSQPDAIEATLVRLLDGYPVGEAAHFLSDRYQEIAQALAEEKRRRPVDEAQLARLWLAMTDARGYVVVGDPAVRLTDR